MAFRDVRPEMLDRAPMITKVSRMTRDMLIARSADNCRSWASAGSDD